MLCRADPLARYRARLAMNCSDSGETTSAIRPDSGPQPSSMAGARRRGEAGDPPDLPAVTSVKQDWDQELRLLQGVSLPGFCTGSLPAIKPTRGPKSTRTHSLIPVNSQASICS